MPKEPLSTITIKTLLAVAIFVGVGTIIIGGGLLIGKQGKVSKPVEKDAVIINDETEEAIIKNKTKDETADWQTYRNEEYGFELKYPKELLINKELQITDVNIEEFKRFSDGGIHLGEFIYGCSLEIYWVNDISFMTQTLSEKYPVNELVEVEDEIYFVGLSTASHAVDTNNCLPVFDQILSTFKLIKK